MGHAYRCWAVWGLAASAPYTCGRPLILLETSSLGWTSQPCRSARSLCHVCSCLGGAGGLCADKHVEVLKQHAVLLLQDVACMRTRACACHAVQRLTGSHRHVFVLPCMQATSVRPCLILQSSTAQDQHTFMDFALQAWRCLNICGLKNTFHHHQQIQHFYMEQLHSTDQLPLHCRRQQGKPWNQQKTPRGCLRGRRSC